MKKIVCFLIVSLGIMAEEFNLNLKYPLETPKVAKEIVTSPLGWQKDDYLKIGIVLGGTALAYTLDEDIREWTQENQSNFGDNLFKVTRPFGEGLPTALFFTYGLLAKDQKSLNTGWMTLEAMGGAIGVTFMMKYVFTRSRPYTNNGNSDWLHGNGSSRDFRSFPSAHSASAFSVATVIASNYSESKWIPELSYTLAALTAVSRIYDDEHWTSDVILGSAIGYFTGKLVYNYRSKDDFMILPSVSSDSLGMTVTGKI